MIKLINTTVLVATQNGLLSTRKDMEIGILYLKEDGKTFKINNWLLHFSDKRRYLIPSHGGIALQY